MSGIILVALVCLFIPGRLVAQPSGGPYGPLPQTYALPKAVHLYYVAPDGKPDTPGATLDQPTTLEAAIARVVSGDAIVLRGGVYRTGGLTFNQGITLQPYADERPVLKGTFVADKWEALRNNVWRTRWERLFPARPLGWWRREREGMITPLHRFNNDMVFVDGELLQSAGHVFVGNLLVARESFTSPLLRFEQPQALCERLTKPQVAELDSNLYVRQGSSREPLITWSPAAAEKCQIGLDSLGALQGVAPAFERNGRAFNGYAGALFRSPELRNYELGQLPPGTQPAASVPPDVLQVLGWKSGPYAPGAFPMSRAAPSR